MASITLPYWLGALLWPLRRGSADNAHRYGHAVDPLRQMAGDMVHASPCV
jgi:hypothetical protein